MRRWLSEVTTERLEPTVPVFLGVHGLVSALVASSPAVTLVMFAGVVLVGVAGLLGWRSPAAAATRAYTLLGVALSVQLIDPGLVSSMLQWYYCVAALYGLLLAGRPAALMGPAAASCYLFQVAVGVGPVPVTVAALRAGVLSALGLTMYVAGRSYRLQRDVAQTRRRDAEAAARELAHAATHDTLTGLPNRTGFLRLLSDQVAARDDGEVAVIALDVDRFASVNDTFGHEAGDRLLVDVATRLRQAEVRAWVGRLGGAEFSLLVTRQPADAVEALAAQVVTALNAPFQVRGHEYRVALSAGVAHHDQVRGGAEPLMRAATLAMQDAKAVGHNVVRGYRPEMAVHAMQRVSLEQQLRMAIRHGELWVAYQPIIDLTTGALSSVEALARWTAPDGTPIPPDVFVPLAEQLGLVEELGLQVLRRAMTAMTMWDDAGLDVGSVAVNASPLQLHNPGFARAVGDLLTRHDLAPARLTLEITEGAVIQASPVVAATLAALRSQGVSISLDDFGTGYSSLSRLRDLPVTEVKIDRSFVAEVSRDATLTRLVLSLAGSFGLHTVAEGVETSEQLDILRDMGIDAAQGYHFARPMSDTDLACSPFAKRRPARA